MVSYKVLNLEEAESKIAIVLDAFVIWRVTSMSERAIYLHNVVKELKKNMLR